MALVITFVPDAAKAVAEMARVVKRGGRVGVIDIRASENPQIAELANRIERIRDDSHTRGLPLSEFERMFAQNGLRIIATEPIELGVQSFTRRSMPADSPGSSIPVFFPIPKLRE